MSKNKNQNKNQTSYEEQNRQLVDALYEQKLVKPCRTRTTNAKRPRAFSIIDLLAFAKGENGCCRSSLFCVGMIPPPPPFVNDNLRKNAVKKKFFHFSAALRIFARRV